MRRFWMVALAVAIAVVITLPAGAKKPDKPDGSSTGFKPVACRVDVAFDSAFVTDATGRDVPALAVDGVFTLTAEESGGFNETRYMVGPVGYSDTDVLCVEVRLTDGTLSDLRVRWLGCQDCGLYRATGKDLRNFNNGSVFSAGVSIADWTDSDGMMTVAVMPNSKSAVATLTVKIGIDHQ